MPRVPFVSIGPLRGSRLWWALPALVAALFAAVLLLRPAPGRSSDATPLQGIRIGQPAPDFILPALSGPPVHLAALRGHPVLLNFWSATCTPCREEMPALDRAARDLASGGGAAPVILGIDDPLDNRASAVRFAQRYHIRYPLLTDTLLAISLTHYHVAYLPTSIFVDRDGMIRSVHLGPLDYRSIVSGLRALR